MNEVYIVTGAAGHLGNTIVRKLLAEHKLVRCLVLPNSNIKSLEGLDCKLYYGDTRKKETLHDIFEVSDGTEIIVIHCAAIVSIASRKNPDLFNVNVNGTKNIADISLEKKVKKFIYVSSVHAIPEGKKGSVIKEVDHFNPDDVKGYYAKSKSEASQYILDKCKEGLNACIVHPSGIIGPYDFGHGHLTQLIIDFCNGSLTACVRGGYDFVDVRDAANGILAAIQYGKVGECYILSGHYSSVVDLLNKLAHITGKKRIKTVLAMWFVKLTAPLAELYYKIRREPPLFTGYSLYTLESNSNFCYAKAALDLGYDPRPLNETLEDTVVWLERNNRIKKRGKKRAKSKKIHAKPQISGKM